jgi:hypothetical protein
MQTDPPKAKPPKRERRWFQFSLRSLLIGVALLALACAYVGWQAKIVRERKAFLQTRYYLPGDSSPDVKPLRAPWMLRLLGAEPIYHITVFGRADAERAANPFPEAFIQDMEGVEQHPPPTDGAGRAPP